MPQLIERLGWVLVHSLWQFAVIAIFAAIVARMLRRSSSILRYVFLVISMGLMLAAPIVSGVVLPGNTDVIALNRQTLAPEAATNSILAATDTAGLSAVSETPQGDPRGERSGVSPSVLIPNMSPSGSIGDNEDLRADPQPLASEVADLLRPFLAWIVAFWAIGVLFCSLRPLLGWRTLRRLRRIGISAPSDEILAAFTRVSTRLGVKRAVQVFNSTLAKGPLVVGYLRPVVLLPVSLATSIPMAQLEAILAHELAHIRRHDFVINLLQTLIETLFFYHPAVWWLSHRIRIEREHCCDDLVIKLFNNAPDYGRALLAVEQLQGQTTSLALGANDGSLLGRIRRIVSPAANQAAGRSWLIFPLILCLCSVTAIVAVNMRSAVGVEEKTEDAVPVSAIAGLPEGIRVEFLGLAAMEDNPTQWWTPNGARLSPAPAYELGGTVRGGNTPLRRALIQVYGLGDDATAVSANMSGERRIEQLASGEKVVLFSGGLQIQPGKQAASLRVGVATDRLSTVRILEANGQRRPTPENAAFDSVAEDIIVKSVKLLSGGNKVVDGKLVPLAETELTFETPNTWRQPDLQIVAFDKEGNPHRNSGGGGRYSTDANAATPGMTEGIVMFPLPLEQIERFEYQFRIYRHWATFENIAIDAGKSTVVKVVIDSIPAEQIRAKAIDGTIVELLGVSIPPTEMPSKNKREWWSGRGGSLTSPIFDSDVLKLTHGGSDNRELVFQLFGPGIFSPRFRNKAFDKLAPTYDAISGNGPMVQVHAVELFHHGKSVAHLDGVGSEIESEIVKTDLAFPSLPRDYFPWVYDPNVNEPCVIHTRFGSIGDADTATVKLQLVTQEPVSASYHPIGKLLEVRHSEDPVLRQAAQRMIDEIRIVRTGPFKDGYAIWTSPFEINNEAGVAAIYLWAIDKSLVTFNGVADGTELRFEFSEPPENVESFDVVVRPYTHMVTFENVSLKPGKQTDVKVSFEPVLAQGSVVANTRFDKAAELIHFAQRLRAIAPADWTVEQADEAFRLQGPKVAKGATQASILLWFNGYNIVQGYLDKRDKSLTKIEVIDNTRIGQGYFVRNKESYDGWADFFLDMRKIEPVDHIAFADLDGLRNIPWLTVALVRDVEVGADGRRVPFLNKQGNLDPIDFGITSVTKYLVIGRLPDPSTASTDEERATAERYLTTVKELRAQAESLGVPVVSVAELDWYTRTQLRDGSSVERVTRPTDPNQIHPPTCLITGEGLVAVPVAQAAADDNEFKPIEEISTKLQGKITNVDAARNLVEISLGADDGLVVGHVFAVYERLPESNKPLPTAKGRIRVTNNIDPDEAIAQIIHLQPNAVLQRGDYVVSEKDAVSDVHPAE